MQVLQSSGDDVPTAVAAFTRRRLPEAHALAQWDLDSEYRLGQMGKLRLAFLGTRFHVLLWMGMSKVSNVSRSGGCGFGFVKVWGLELRVWATFRDFLTQMKDVLLADGSLCRLSA